MQWKLGVMAAIAAVLASGCALDMDGVGGDSNQILGLPPLLDDQLGQGAAGAVPPLTSHQELGRSLFDEGLFGGNGRTCRTCHPSASGESGQLSAADVEARLAADPDDPLFQHDGADSGDPDRFARLRTNATIQVTLPLPDNLSIVGSEARTITVLRSVPTTMNVAALDPVLMWDGRAPSLQSQALGAIVGHAQGGDVDESELDAIADFETTLFNRAALRNYGDGGPAPQLPLGTTVLEIYGRTFFTPDGINAKCGWCHSGPMLNETSPFFKTLILLLEGTPGPEPGTRFEQLGLGELNDTGNPVYTFRFTHPDGTHTDVTSPDPGRALITGNVADVDFFKIPTVWGAKHTAPYFHDNSARTLEELVDVYDRVFRRNSMVVDGVSINFLTPLDKQAIVAYLKLL